MSYPKPHRPAEAPDPCRLIVVQDQLQPCPYLAGNIARMPLRLPVGRITPEATDQLLQVGFRRSGEFLYRPECPACRACESTRVEVERFHWTASLRRVLRRGDRELACRWGEPQCDRRRVTLFNEHRRRRELEVGDGEVDAVAYRSFLVDSSLHTEELVIEHARELVAVAIVDVGQASLSAVYTYFDPAASRLSLGTYAILKQIERAEREGHRYVYLGMHVAANRHLNYKARFRPQQRLIAGRWQEIGD